MLFGLPRRAGLFWLLVVAAASAALFAGWRTSEISILELGPVAIVFIFVTALAERVQVRLAATRPGRDEVMYSLSCTLDIATVLLFPLPLAATIAAAGTAIGVLLRGQRNPLKLIFNAA